MTATPFISVQLVHLQGPSKGEIQDLGDSEIRIGRHPDCQVNFPKDLTTLSRVHARIIREGNRFKLIDQSTNGTFVNGQRVTEAYLKDGDVLMFSDGGPKVSFLTQTSTAAPVSSKPAPPTARPEPAASPAFQARATTGLGFGAPPPTPKPAPMTPPSHAATQPISRPVPPAPETVKAPLAIQYGPALKSFQTLPIVIGSAPGCDFIISHPNVGDHHAQIFFAANQYWIKDLTGRGTILINSQPIPGQAALTPDMQLALSDRGPKFRFMAGGRLAEIDEPLPATPAPSAPPQADRASKGPGATDSKKGNFFKKFFS
ncbi:MAG: FHA domain-containing protein [Desulfobacteraceae bacterium]|nr:FHA domain-containing protein [Desulfobacteraceae bacterium]